MKILDGDNFNLNKSSFIHVKYHKSFLTRTHKLHFNNKLTKTFIIKNWYELHNEHNYVCYYTKHKPLILIYNVTIDKLLIEKEELKQLMEGVSSA